MGKYQLQILLYGVHRDTDNPFGQPFGHTIDSLRQETLRLRQIFEQQSTKNSVGLINRPNPEGQDRSASLSSRVKPSGFGKDFGGGPGLFSFSLAPSQHRW